MFQRVFVIRSGKIANDDVGREQYMQAGTLVCLSPLIKTYLLDE